ncbi:hypothetical protein GXW82_43605 [Streptacidiphilus sp. 4-A2]|nr:hypothetical protein [Streptacidiphilus sp. 4-A2]
MSATLAAALALAEHLLPARFRDGRQVVRVADAHVLLTGHAPRIVADWEQWSDEDKQRVGALLGARHRGEALLHHVERAVYDVFHTPDADDPLPALYALGRRERGRALEVVPNHGQDPAEVAVSSHRPGASGVCGWHAGRVGPRQRRAGGSSSPFPMSKGCTGRPRS